MRLIFVGLMLIFSSSGIAESTEDVDYWELSTILNIRHYLSKEENKALLDRCDGFLNMPEMLSINHSITKAKLDYIIGHIKTTELPSSLPERENTVIGSLICGLGGGSVLSVVFRKETKSAITVVLIPGM